MVPLYHPTVTTVSLGSHTLLDFYEPLSSSSSSQEAGAPQTEESRYRFSLLVQPRSLLVLQDHMYQSLLHGVQPHLQDTLTNRVLNLPSSSSSAAAAAAGGGAAVVVGDTLTRGTRVSLTIRHVPKVMKTKLFLGRK
ncbi:hypothetical protein CRUP_002700 [Coryphaenoides rupestris]|nr:hypothetical protein CRUP_002700 [Coryphaenoides rupestris]